VVNSDEPSSVSSPGYFRTASPSALYASRGSSILSPLSVCSVALFRCDGGSGKA